MATVSPPPDLQNVLTTPTLPSLLVHPAITAIP
jgi:hypothetical protein